MTTRTRIFTAIATGLLLGGAAITSPLAAETIQAKQLGDARLTCAQIESQVSKMEDIENQSQQLAGNANNTKIGLGLFSGVAGSVGVGGSLGAAIGTQLGARTASSVAGSQSAQAAQTAHQAQARRNVLIGIHTGKGCGVSKTAPAAGGVNR